ncbi:MAG TPA: TonB-dependent receptor [Planctomycetota bacterium]|nr:TonB-dependent receptor [Planctomycetota bacterium]
MQPAVAAATKNTSGESQAPASPQTPAEQKDKSGHTILDTVVVTAEEGVPLTYPGGRDVIDAETKDKYPDGSIATLLRRVPGVYFLPENGNDSRINVGLRGNDPRRSALTSVLVDGIPVCEAPYGNTDIDGMPIATERIWLIDVIRGGASIRYGPNSAGGIINMLTEPVPDAPMLRLGSRIGSDNAYSESLATGGTWGPYGVLVTGVVKGGNGFRDNGEYTDWDGALKMRYALSPSESVLAYVSRFDEPGAEQPGGLTQASYGQDPDQSTRHGADFDFDMNRYVLEYDNVLSADSSLQLKGWYQEGTRILNDFRPIVPPFVTTRVQDSEFSSGALEGSYSWTTELFGLKHSFLHSARYLREVNDEFYYRVPLAGGPVVTPFDLHAIFKGTAFSLFTEDVVSLTEHLAWGIGFRLENLVMTGHSHDNGREVVKEYRQFLPESNLTWTVAETTALYASYQKGFYPPQYETGFDPASILFAPTDPESSDAFEVGVRSHAISGLETSLAVFDTEFEDKIDFINLPNGQKLAVNTGRARSRGVELGLNYDFGAASESLDGLSVYGTITELRSEIETGANEGNDTPNSPHALASWGVEYQHHRTGLWGRFGGSHSAKSFKDPANTAVGSADGVNGPQPAYTLWDCAVGWNQKPDRSGFGLALGVTNLFDEEYFRRFSTGIFPGAPREYFAAISYTVFL